jgi:hypothetical protein
MVYRYRRLPHDRAVTIFANVSRLDVSWSLAGCLGAVVTARAIDNDIFVIEVGRCPDNRRMTALAIITTRNMRQVFADCLDAVVTVNTSTDNVLVAEVRRRPSRRCMAVITGVSARDVSRVFAACCYSVVAASATAKYLRVINIEHGVPDRGGMTVLAKIRGLNVCKTFSSSRSTVVTTNTIANNISVIENSGHPGCRIMAVIALLT